MIRVFIVAFCLFVLASCSGAQEFVVPITSHPPVIDGRIDASEWAVSDQFDGFGYGDVLKQPRVSAWVGADETNIYVAIRSQLPTSGDLWTGTSDGMPALYWGYDTMGAQVNPTPGASREACYQILVNSKDVFRYRPHTRGRIWENPAWEGGWRQAGSLRDGYWEWECAIPIAGMTTVAKGRRTTDGTWSIDLNRDFRAGLYEAASLSCQSTNSYFSEGGYHLFTGLPFRFSKSAPAVHFSIDRDPFVSAFTGNITISNPSNAPITLRTDYELKKNGVHQFSGPALPTLEPGKRWDASFTIPEDSTAKDYSLRITATSTDGKIVYYDRNTNWQKAPPLKYVGNSEAQKPPIAFDYAYYPTKNLLRARADISNLPSNVKLSGLTATVREKSGGKEIASALFALDGFKSGKQEVRISLPPLRGEYELILKPEGANAPAVIVKEFERNVYPWENGNLGKSTKVYPPFKPITLKGRVLSTVLKTHTLNDQGLLDQITAQSAQTGVTKPMLAAPMRYSAVVDGKPVAVSAVPIKIVSAEENQVKTTASLDAAGVQIVSADTWDYDGTVKVELTIQPTSRKRLDKLDLEIPFDGKVIAMIDAYADRRGPVASYLPKRKGVIWDATMAAYSEYPRTFCPYVFLGSPVRGLCWFAENDRGWLRDPAKPNMEVTRSGGRMVLRIHLVNKPTVLTQPTTIVFGMLGAPIKPRLDPAKGPNWSKYRFVKDNYHLMSTDIVWGALGNCGSVYPVGRDMTIWDAIKQGNERGLTSDEAKETVDRVKHYFEPYGPDMVKMFASHLTWGLTSSKGKKIVFYYNRASFQACEEFQTFKDEWDCSDYRSVGKGISREEVTVIPTPSYIDYCLYWYKKSFEHAGNTAVYWDNWVFKLTWNTEMTQSYVDGDSVVPATGIWELRELSKRTFQMMNELGMTPITFPHMTAHHALPMMSFATLQYDWEWKYSWGDVQDRFLPEYIQLVSNGELSGVWPVTLGDMGKLSGDPWTQRTFTAVKLLHELDGPGQFAGWGASKENIALAKPIMDILDNPATVAYRYWDETPQPVKSDNPNLPSAVYCIPGRETIAAVVSYSDKDEMVRLKVDAAKLGLSHGYTVTDTETGETIKAAGNIVRFPLKKHDIRVLRFAVETKSSSH